MLRQNQGGDHPAERERRYHPQHGHQQGREPDPHHVAHGGFESYFEEKYQHAELGQDFDRWVVGVRVEPWYSDEVGIAQNDTDQQLAENGWLIDEQRKMAAELGGHQYHGKGDDDRGNYQHTVGPRKEAPR